MRVIFDGGPVDPPDPDDDDQYTECVVCGDYYASSELSCVGICANCEAETSDYTIDFETECPECGHFPLSESGACRNCLRKERES